MPELPEVEVVRLGISPLVLNQKIVDVKIRHPQLRFPIPTDLKIHLVGQPIRDIIRRGKYLLFKLPKGTLILHLGMSGSIRILTKVTLPKKHDHVDIVFSSGRYLRYNDPRRFGALLWTNADPMQHLLLSKLGPEPLSDSFTGKYLWAKAKNRKVAVKTFLMNSHIVVGVGNIYANEALYEAKIHPLKSAGEITLDEWNYLCRVTKKLLQKAIKQGGTTLKDFVNSEGKPGYFKQHLKAYGQEGKPCPRCASILIPVRVAQRATVFCSTCQKK